jgi:hypothetical protein
VFSVATALRRREWHRHLADEMGWKPMPQDAFLLHCQPRLTTLILAAMNFTKNIGMLLLAVYLILAGLQILLSLAIPAVVMALLAILAGIFILIGR